MFRFMPVAAIFAVLSSSVWAADVVDTAQSNAELKTFVTAVKAAGLEDTLKGPGPYTVFAPSDAAFAKMSQSELDALMKDKEKLKTVLLHHVIEGKMTAADVMKKTTANTVKGDAVSIQAMGDKVMVGNAKVVTPDIAGDNGVIHIIDTVIMPSDSHK